MDARIENAAGVSARTGISIEDINAHAVSQQTPCYAYVGGELWFPAPNMSKADFRAAIEALAFSKARGGDRYAL